MGIGSESPEGHFGSLDGAGAGGGGGGNINNNTLAGNISGAPAPAIGLTVAQVQTLLGVQPSNNVAITGGSITGTNITFPGLASGMVLSVAGVLATATNLNYDDTAQQLGLGIATGAMLATTHFQVQGNNNGAVRATFNNTNAGAGAFTEVRLQGNAVVLAIDMYSSGVGGGFGNSGQISVTSGAGSLYLSHNGSGDTVWTMGGTNIERMRLTNAGVLSVAHLSAQTATDLTLTVPTTHAMIFQGGVGAAEVFRLAELAGSPGQAFMTISAGTTQAPGAVAVAITNAPPGVAATPAFYWAIADDVGHPAYIPVLQ